MKLTIEFGPLQPEKRLAIIERLEEMGVAFSLQSKEFIVTLEICVAA